MRFALTEEQAALRDATRELLASRCQPDLVRAAWPGGDPDAVTALWRALDELGLLGALGAGTVDDVGMIALLTEVGYAAVPLPVAASAFLAAPLIDPLPGPVALVDDRAGGLTHFAGVAAAFLVLDGSRVLLVDAGSAELIAEPTVDGSLCAARVRVPAGAGRELPGLDPATLRDRADLAAAAELVGLGRRMLDLTVGYVSQRHQFGVPVGGLQAVAHPLADALLRLEFAAPAVLAAAWSLSAEPGSVAGDAAGRDVSAAALLAKEAAEEVARTALQSHGAIGYTVEYDLHLYAKRVWALASTIDTDAHLDRLAAALDLATLTMPRT
jgi:alkylation response protein AidB-like acyl-CoA dehydrogenase